MDPNLIIPPKISTTGISDFGCCCSPSVSLFAPPIKSKKMAPFALDSLALFAPDSLARFAPDYLSTASKLQIGYHGDGNYRISSGDDSLFYKRLIITHNKHLNHGDFLIDDRLKNDSETFTGQLIHFGTPGFPDWAAVKGYLLKSV